LLLEVFTVKSFSTAVLLWSIKILLIGLLTLLTWRVISTVPDWTAYDSTRRLMYGLIAVTAIISLIHRPLWQRLRLNSNLMRTVIIVILMLAAAVLIPAEFAHKNFVLTILGFFSLLVLSIGTILNEHRPTNLANLAVSAIAVSLMFLAVETFAPRLTASIAEAQRQSAIEQYDAAFQAANHPEDAAAVETDTSGVQLYAPQVEILESEPGPAWGELTGWGTSVNTVMHYWLEGVYDNLIEYNSLGFRGAEIAYEKPDDVYRILLVGDSFIEAREVAYEDTVYARLGELLADATTPNGRRIEVFGVGATGWGTLQSYLYYHHEGQRFDPDLVISVFVINDVVDNLPSAFYPTRDIEFALTENSVQVISRDTASSDAAPQSALKRLLDTAPQFIAQSNIAQLLLQVFDPPRQAVTIAGDLTKLHPQNYIYVRYPEVDNYPEAWERTRQAYTIWANEVQAHDAELLVLAVDPSVDRISEISTYFEEARGWVWDVDLPTMRLHEILDPLQVPLIETRAAYAAYAESVNASPFSTLFYVEDGHWNPTGHRVTAELLAATLRERNIVNP
jgi:hypothetical protein